jgi:hypothetical protein
VVEKKSEPSEDYNCIAWAANEDFRVWWPDVRRIGYWPEDVAREETLDAFIAAYATLGYERCADGELENGFEKVVLYMHQGKPTHAAVQLASGFWSSKLGQSIDVEHDTPEAIITEVAGLANIYGAPVQFLRRSR